MLFIPKFAYEATAKIKLHLIEIKICFQQQL